jgi:peptidoglycan/LPS O-acetylase OafA/YrhL
VSWSLVAEVTFYASLPVLALAAIRLRRGVPGILTAASPVLLLLATGVCTRLAVAVLLGKPPVGGATGLASSWDVKSTGHSWVAVLADGMLCNADLFALGMGIAVALVAVEEARLGPAAIRALRRLFGLALVLAPLCFLVVVAATDSTLLSAPVFGAACTGLIALILLPGGGWFVRSAERLLGTATLRYLGRISYSVYLWHLPVMLFLLVHRPGLRYSSYPTLVGDYALVCVLTLALAALTYHVVEAPALRLKGPAVQRSTPRRSLREAEEAA